MALLLSIWSSPILTGTSHAAYSESWDDEEPEEEVSAVAPNPHSEKTSHPASVESAASRADDETDASPAAHSPADWEIQVTEQDRARSQEYLEQGKAQFAMRYLENAKAAYDKAIALDPGNADAYAARAEVYYFLGTNRRKKSLDPMEQALAQVELAQSVKDCTAALDLKPDTASFHKQRGTASQALGQYDAALADISAALKANPDSYSLYDQRAMIQLERGQYDLALEDLYQALALNPRDRLNGYYRGLVFARQGKHEEALAKFDEATSGGAWFASAWLQKGMICEKLDRPLDALYAYRTFLSLDREHDAATIAFINERFNAIDLRKK